MNLITGATGLLGSHIAEQLIAAGEPVRALVRPTSRTDFLESIGAELVTGDVTDPASIESAISGVKRVYHAAAKVGDWGPWEQFQKITIEGTRNMLTAARDAGVERFLHISSISAYGHPDGEGLVLDESAPLGVNLHKWSYYSRAKVEAEHLVWAAWERGEVPLTVVRPSWLYGPRDRASMPRLIRVIREGKARLVGDGENRLNLTYAGNEAEGCILAATNPDALGESYNLSNDGVITQKEYLNKIAECLGVAPVKRKVPYPVAYQAAMWMEIFGHLLRRKSPPMATRYAIWLIGRKCFFSAEKARNQLGWTPTVGYQEGIEKSVAWCLEHAMDK
jgi:nucleoside-diphosphate-sugar epimerase